MSLSKATCIYVDLIYTTEQLKGKGLVSVSTADRVETFDGKQFVITMQTKGNVATQLQPPCFDPELQLLSVCVSSRYYGFLQGVPSPLRV